MRGTDLEKYRGGLVILADGHQALQGQARALLRHEPRQRNTRLGRDAVLLRLSTCIYLDKHAQLSGKGTQRCGR